MDQLEKKIIDAAMRYAKECMAEVPPSHGFDHVIRVVENAKYLAKDESDVDIFIITVAAILHDIARHEQDLSGGKVCHAIRGAKMAKDFLLENGLDAARTAHITQCILSHRFREESKPETLEAEILFDADKLESIGAIGIGRAFLFAGEIGAKLHDPNIDEDSTESYSNEDTAYREYLVKLRKVKDSMLTKKGMELALSRHEFMKVFFEQLTNEVKSKA